MKRMLADVCPELINEWSQRNLPLTPDSVTHGSNKIVWWNGKCGHEWRASVKNRVSKRQSFVFRVWKSRQKAGAATISTAFRFLQESLRLRSTMTWSPSLPRRIIRCMKISAITISAMELTGFITNLLFRAIPEYPTDKVINK